MPLPDARVAPPRLKAWQRFDRRIAMSVVNDGQDLGHETGSNVTLQFNADLAVALPEGPLAAGE